MSFCIFEITLLIFVILDVQCYALAKYPERMKWWAKLPGGGIAALKIYGREK